MSPMPLWSRLLLALLIAVLAVVGLFLIVRLYPNRSGKTPAPAPGVSTFDPESSPLNHASPGLNLPWPDVNVVMQHETLLRPWSGRWQQSGPDPLKINGRFVLRYLPSSAGFLRLSGPTMNRFQLDLWDGSQGVRLTMEEDQVIRSYQIQSMLSQPVPAPGTLRDDRFYRKHSLLRLEKSIAHRWRNNPPHSGVDADHFTVRWTGFVHVPREGMHYFEAQTDDGCRLRIDGKLVIDDWKGHQLQWAKGNMHLSRGWHGFVFEYYETIGDATACLFWARPGQIRSEIPANFVTPAADDTHDWLTRLKPDSIDPDEDPDKQGWLAVYFWGPTQYPPLSEPASIEPIDLDTQPDWRPDSPLDIRYRDGQVLLTRGPHPLLAVPMQAPPSAATLQIDGQLRTLQYLPVTHE
ncbi:MAG: hypothetical protein HC898_03980 [Phycisphaerales bacterium]|nr:hypothetical protein [Phycisphaerales bacterium]